MDSTEGTGPISIKVMEDFNNTALPEEDDRLKLLRKLREKCRVQITDNIPEPETIMEIGGFPTFTAGNISTIIGKAKSKKSFFVTALIAAYDTGNWEDQLKGYSNGKKILWIDTEQHESDTKMMLVRAEALGVNMENVELLNMRVIDLEQMEIVEGWIYDSEGFGLVVIDGIRDLINDILSPEQATLISRKLLKWSAEKEVHICNVLHTNKADNNARGHLGTELVNKSEATLLIEEDVNDPSFSKIAADYVRRRKFKDFGLTIEENLPVYFDLDSRMSEAEQKSPAGVPESYHLEVIKGVFLKNSQYRYDDLRKAIREAFEVKGRKLSYNNTVDHLKHYKACEWIVNERRGIWTIGSL